MAAPEACGQVVRLDRKVCWVALEGGATLPCPLRGRFFEHESESTRPVAVGDRVRIRFEDDSRSAGVIEEVLPRSSSILRSSVREKGKVQVLAANVEQVLVVASLRQPSNRPGLVDRLLVGCESRAIPAVVVLNKRDLCTAEEVEEFLEPYREVGYPVAAVSAKEGTGLDEVKERMRGKLCLLLGHSGVGKSSLLNALDPSLSLRTGEVSRRHGKGMHTTTSSQLLDLCFGARVVDSPGIREFSLEDLEDWELSGCFPEFRGPMQECRFQPCSHSHEPDCAVRAAVDGGRIRAERYETYRKLLEESKGGGQRMPRHGSF